MPCLEAVIASGNDVVAVYTQPDRPSGRGRALTPSPVKQRALASGLHVMQPSSLRDPHERRSLQALRPDLMVVVAYGLLLTSNVLAVPRLGCWNVHASILPRWRGAAPIQRALLAGDRETGVDLMQMEKGLDTGPVIMSARTRILDSDTSATLHDRLASMGAQILAGAIDALDRCTLPQAQPQTDVGVLYAHKIEKGEAVLDFDLSVSTLERKVRAFSSWPVAETVLAGERLRVHSALTLPRPRDGANGALVGAHRDGIDILASDGILRITRMQRDGGKVIGAADYLNARPELRDRR